MFVFQQSVHTSYRKQFAGTTKLHLKEDVEPFTDAPRKCSVHVKEKLKQELNSRVSEKVIHQFNGRTDWCSSLTFSTKKDVSTRLCLDPKILNDDLKRCPHKIPTVEELNANTTVFSKVDAKAGYWVIHIDEESQLVTSFQIQFGWYCWKRIPFGLF